MPLCITKPGTSSRRAKFGPFLDRTEKLNLGHNNIGEIVTIYLSSQDCATTDSPFYDPAFPPEHFPTHFMSGGSPVQAFMWLAPGEGAKGCAIFVPQVYGGDSLESLVTPLLAAGIHVMKFYPRGMWDSQDYSLTGAVDDVNAAVAFLRQNDGEHQTIEGRSYQIHLEHIAVIGKCGGGMQGWAAAAENPHLKAAIAVAPANIELGRGGGAAPAEDGPTSEDMLTRLTASTAGRIDIAAWQKSLTPKDYDRLSLIHQAPKLVDKKLLLVGASADRHIPLETNHRPIAEAQRLAGAKDFTEAILEGDTFFLTARIALARLTIDWLRSTCHF
jgi:hypothetical protein